MTLSQLRYFVTVCETGSLTSAAELLFVTQPAVSKALRELEAEWGFQLFTRQSNRLVITRKGETAYEKAKVFLAQADHLTNEIQNIGVNNRKLTIVMNASTSLLFFPTLIRDFREEYPDVHIDLIEVKEHADVEMATNPDADILIMSNIRHKIDENRFDRVHLFNSEYVVIVGPNSSLKDVEYIDDNVKCDKPMIIDYYPKDIYEDGKFAPKRLVPFLNGKYIRTMSSQFALNFQLVQDDQAYTFTYKEIAEDLPNIKAIPLDPPWTQEFDLYYPKIKSTNIQIMEFLDFAKDYDYTFEGAWHGKESE